MKKLKLDFQRLNAEVLTRSQMKTILGGLFSNGGGTTCNCNSNDDCSGTKATCYNGAAYNCTNTKGNSFAGVCDE